jgi:membrane protease YdiL (CAAX protease family)
MPSSPARGRQWGLADGAAGMVLSFSLLLGAGQHVLADQHQALLLSYLAAWIPLLGAVLVACYLRGSRSLARDCGLRFRLLDLLWGLAIGMLARVVASLVEIGGYGHLGGGAVTLGTTVHDGWWVFGAILAPVILAPLIEELFFRGLLLRSLLAALRGTGGIQRATAIVISGSLFAMLHMFEAGFTTTAIVVGTSTFLFGVAAATVATLTGRLGGAIIAHITFNALGVVPGLIAGF